jgi:repressor LexA
MRPRDFKKIRREELGMTQQQIAEKLGTTRMTVTRYECGTRRIPGVVEVALRQVRQGRSIPMLGTVAAGKPIQPVAQSEVVDFPFAAGGENFALRISGDSMRDEGIVSGDLVIVRKQSKASVGQTVIALVNGQATVKKYYPKGDRIELRPANDTMQPIQVTAADDFEIQGIVIGLVRRFK